MASRRPSRESSREPFAASLTWWSRELGIGTPPLSAAIRDGSLIASKIPGVRGFKITRTAIEHWLASQRVCPGLKR